MTLEAFANKIAAKAFITELNNARMLGHSATESFVLAMDSLDETFNRVFDAERPSPAQRGDEVNDNKRDCNRCPDCDRRPYIDGHSSECLRRSREADIQKAKQPNLEEPRG